MREMPETIHGRTIKLLKRDYPQAATRGFRKSVQQMQWDVEKWGESPESPTWEDFMEYGEAWKGGILPDLWFIDHECMSVVCIEVEDTHPVNTSKLYEYERLWWHLDNIHWEAHLICSDRWGNLTPVPLASYTGIGQVEIEGHRLKEVIQAEREKNQIVFELTKIYSIRGIEERELARLDWLKKYPRFSLAGFLNRHDADGETDAEVHEHVARTSEV